MSLYNMLLGSNPASTILLHVLGLSAGQVPRLRNVYQRDGKIIIYTRTGGGNRDFYGSEAICRSNYPDYFDGTSDQPSGPWNGDLQANPYYLEDSDDDFDSTYASFVFRYPESYQKELEALEKEDQTVVPSEAWKLLIETLTKKPTEAKS